MKVPSTITQPTDPKRLTQLRRKLKEYRGRSIDPAFYLLLSYRRLDTTCKTTVLQAVLNSEKIDVEKLRQVFHSEHDEEFADLDIDHYFNRAVKVIHSYCETGGKDLWGGTGLSNPESKSK